MGNELLINSVNNDYRIALLEGGKLFEYHVDKADSRFVVGDIYLGRIKKIMPSLNAAFVDIGYKKDAFLHYLDLGPQFMSLQKAMRVVKSRGGGIGAMGDFAAEPQINKSGKMGDLLAKGDEVLVQVVKEPISSKGPRLTSELTLPGRYMILVPFIDTIHISKKITNVEERERLYRLISSIKPKNFGIIIRTVAKDMDVASLDRDLRELVAKWKKGLDRLATAVVGSKIIGEVNRVYTILRDILNGSFDGIVVDDPILFEDLKKYVCTIAPGKEQILRYHHGKVKLFEQFGVEEQLKTLFGKTVGIENGGYLVIDHTEAMHVIDVNSGSRAMGDCEHQKMALHVNLSAAKEIARQLRLRDMGGIIVIDFIDMKEAEERKAVYLKVKELMKEDRAKASVLPLSKFGIMQITRQRVRPEMNVVTCEVCPSCGGAGKIDASILVSKKIEEDLKYILVNQNERGVTLSLHPYLYAFFTQKLISRRLKWLFRYGRWVTLVEDSSMAITEYKFFNTNKEEIVLD